MFAFIHGSALLQLNVTSDAAHEIPKAIENWTGLKVTEYFLTQNGRPVASSFHSLPADIPLRINERLVGGKGGFGSMLRAIGAQIEKTTNREACRDLSGRRLRDINEEKRLKAYLEKQQDASEDERVKIQKKIEKLLSKPKHEFEDKEYEHQRSELIVETDEALQEGLQKVAQLEQNVPASVDGGSEPVVAGKRKRPDFTTTKAKKKKTALWLGNDDLSSSSETESDSGEDGATSSETKASTKDAVEQKGKEVVVV